MAGSWVHPAATKSLKANTCFKLSRILGLSIGGIPAASAAFRYACHFWLASSVINFSGWLIKVYCPWFVPMRSAFLSLGPCRVVLIICYKALKLKVPLNIRTGKTRYGSRLMVNFRQESKYTPSLSTVATADRHGGHNHPLG